MCVWGFQHSKTILKLILLAVLNDCEMSLIPNGDHTL